MSDIAGLNGGLVKTTPDLTDLLPIQDAQGITRPTSIAGVINAVRNAGATGDPVAPVATGATSWQLKTANYTAIPGDKLRLDATASDIVITLPSTPSATDADILFQRLESGINKVLLRTGANKFNTQANQDGVFTPATINLIEGISYVNSTIGWLNQHNRLTFQAHAPLAASDPLFSSVVLLMPMTTMSGITDVKGKVTTNQGSTSSTARNDPFGNNVGVRDFAGAGARISVAQSNDFAFGSGAYAIEMWLYPTVFPAGNSWGILDTRPLAQVSDWVLAGDSTGKIGFVDFSFSAQNYEFSLSPLILNQWNYVCMSRTDTESHKIWINGVLVRSATTRSNSITANGALIVGDQIDASYPYDGSFTGSISNLRITRAYRDGSIVPTAAFPIN